VCPCHCMRGDIPLFVTSTHRLHLNMSRRRHPTIAVVTHLTAVTLTVAATVLLLLVVLYNAPLPADAHPDADDAQARWWLVQVTDNTAPRVVGVPIEHATRTTPAGVTTVIPPGSHEVKRQSGDRYSANGGVDGRQMYGFGSWGWCEWHRDDPFGDATCRTKAFWRIPRDAVMSEVAALNLPGYVVSTQYVLRTGPCESRLASLRSSSSYVSDTRLA
jgi:hypothetical protein